MYGVDYFGVGGEGIVAFVPIDELRNHLEKMKKDGWEEDIRHDISGVDLVMMYKGPYTAAIAGIQAW